MAVIHSPSFSIVSWSGVIAGALFGLLTLMILSAIGVAVAGEALQVGNFSEVGWGGIIWLAICLLVSGFVAGRTAVTAQGGQLLRDDAGFNGALAATVLFMVLTFFSYSLLFSGIRGALGLAGEVAQGGAQAASQIDLAQAARSLNLEQEYRALTGELDRGAFEQAIAQADPALSQAQVSAVSRVVTDTLSQGRSEITQNLRQPGELPQVVNEAWQRTRARLSGNELQSRLQGAGLSAEQAQRARSTIEQRMQELEAGAQQALQTLEQRADQLTEAAGSTVAKGAWSWIIAALLVIGCGLTGGRSGARYVEPGEDRRGAGDRPGREERLEPLHH